MRLLQAALLGGFAVLPIACAAILGDDFEIVPSGSGEGGGGAGVNVGGAAGPGGAGGAAGGEPAPYYDCDWDFPEHRLVQSLEATPTSVLGKVFAVRRGPDSVRAIVNRITETGVFFDIFTLDSSANIATASVPSMQVLQVERLSSSNMGILYVTPTAELHLYVIADSSQNGDDGNDITLASATNLPNFTAASSALNAMMAPVPLGGLDDWDLDVVVMYRNTSMEQVIYHARYERNPLPTFVRITDPALNLNDNDTQGQAIAHFDGTTYAYFGETGSVLGLSVYALDENVTGFVTPTPIGQGEQLGGVLVVPPDYANVLMADVGPPIRLLTGAVAGADLGSLDPADLNIAAEFAGQLDLPVFEADGRWNEDIFTLIGPDSDNSIDMAYYLLDNVGRERGLGPLDFTLILPAEEDRDNIGSLASALRDEPLGAEGGTLHILWTEDHTRNNVPFDVLYYDRLRCTPQ
jgi:hypothetical protein